MEHLAVWGPQAGWTPPTFMPKVDNNKSGTCVFWSGAVLLWLRAHFAAHPDLPPHAAAAEDQGLA